jgi:transcription initiation factor TFIID TATA-box-binding protein
VFETKEVEGAVKVVNVVASATLRQRVNLKAVVKGFPSAEFPSERFPGLAFRLKKPKTTTLIFSSGKMICTGGKSENEARKAVESVVGKLSKERIITPRTSKVKINNIVASANLGRCVDLESMSGLRGTMYEPDQFPALIYRLDDPKVVFLVFSTGRLVCVGAKSEKEVHRGIRGLFQRLEAMSPSESPSFHKANRDVETRNAKCVPTGRIKLSDFTSSEDLGKACVYVPGLWCHHKYCDGPSCRFANMIQKRVIDGFYGCWGFHWQQGWHTAETKRSQRKFNN